MARRTVNPVDQSGEILRPADVDTLTRTVFEIARITRDAGWMSDRAFDNLEITSRSRCNGKINALRRPVELTSAHSPKFVIFEDVLRSHFREFRAVLAGPLTAEESRSLANTYSAASAVGEFVLRRTITDPFYARSIDRTVAVSKMLTDTDDFTSHFQSRIVDKRLRKIMSTVDDSALIEINGIRAGLTIVRAATQEVTGADFMTEDVVLACNAALERYITEIGPSYIGVANYVNVDPSLAVGAFTYAIHEWLYALAVPMSADKLSPIFDEEHVSKIGPSDLGWSPSIDL